MSLLDAIKYGWNVDYILQVEGCKTLFVEHSTGLSFSGGGPFADHNQEDASLVIDDSAKVGSEIDRYTGLGVGLNFSFKLIDSTITAGLMSAPSLVSFLDENVSATDTSIKVDAVTGWPASGSFYLGKELVSYSSIVGNEFQVSSRGVAGKAYQHRQISAGNQVTNKIRWWKGRQVTLWAMAVDPAGVVPGTNYANTSNLRQIWKGQIVDGPGREPGCFTFEAVSMERLLDVPLFGGASGSVVSTEPMHTVDTSWLFGGFFRAISTTGADLWTVWLLIHPFASLTPGTLYTGTQLRQTMADAFDDAVTALGASSEIQGIEWQPNYQTSPFSNVFPLKSYSLKLVCPYAANMADIVVEGATWTNGDYKAKWPLNASVSDPIHFDLGYTTNDSPQETIGLYGQIPNGPLGMSVSGLSVQLDEGADATIPSNGTILLSQGDKKGLLDYSYTGTGGGVQYFEGLKPSSAGAFDFQPGDIVGASAQIIYNATGTLHDVALKTVCSSGTAGLRHATYDAYQLGAGYGIDQADVNIAGFEKLKGIPLKLSSNMAGASFADCFGGLLGLSRFAIVTRPSSEDYKDIQLTAVSTALGGSDYVAIITDADVLALRGQPVEMLTPAEPPNIIKVTQAPDGGINEIEESAIIYSDAPSVMALGAVEQEWTVPALNRSELMLASLPWATSYLAEDRTAFAIRLIVPPWLEVYPGDPVRCEGLTHPALWNFSTGAPGYTGPGLCVGRLMDLRTLSVELTLLVQGSVSSFHLSPSMEVLAFDNAASPTSVTVDGKYYDHLARALEGNTRVELLHYFPGQAETDSEFITYNAVSKVGSNAVLNVIIEGVTGLSLANKSHLTLPRSGDANIVTYQTRFAHCDSGGHWA